MDVETATAGQLVELAAGLNYGPAIVGFATMMAGAISLCGCALLLHAFSRERIRVSSEKVRGALVLAIAATPVAASFAVFAWTSEKALPDVDVTYRKACGMAAERALDEGASARTFEALLGTCGSRRVLAVALSKHGEGVDDEALATLQSLSR